MWPAAPEQEQGELQRSTHRGRCGQLKRLETHVCGFEGRLIAYYQGHWEPLLPSILIVGWVFKPTRSNTFWVLLLQDLYVFYQNVSSNGYNRNLCGPTMLDDSFWVAQFFSHPVTVSETSNLPRDQNVFVNNTRSSVHIMSGLGQNHKSSTKNPSIRSKLCSHKPKSTSLVQTQSASSNLFKKVNRGLI